MLLVGVAGRERDPPPADDDEGRLDVGEVVVEDGGVGEGEADIGVADLDPAGPHGPVRGDADLVHPGHGPRDFEPAHGPGPPAALQAERPGLDEGRVVVLEERLDEEAGRSAGVPLDTGQTKGDSGHLEIVEEEPHPGLFGRPDVGPEGFEVSVERPAPEKRLQALHEGRRGFGRGSGGDSLAGGRPGEEEEQEEDPEDRFSQGWPHYRIHFRSSSSIEAGFVPRPISPILKAPARTSPTESKELDREARRRQETLRRSAIS